jgi:hypothetical protein
LKIGKTSRMPRSDSSVRSTVRARQAAQRREHVRVDVARDADHAEILELVLSGFAQPLASGLLVERDRDGLPTEAGRPLLGFDLDRGTIARQIPEGRIGAEHVIAVAQQQRLWLAVARVGKPVEPRRHQRGDRLLALDADDLRGGPAP